MSDIRTLSRSLQPGVLLDLWELDLTLTGGDVLYFHNGIDQGSNTITFKSKVYNPFPIEAEGFEWNTKGVLPRPTLRVSNIGSYVSALLRLHDDFIGATITRHRTFQSLLADGKEFSPEIYKIERKKAETSVSCEFELATHWDSEGIQLPLRQVLANSCVWVYRGPECSYVGPPKQNKDAGKFSLKIGSTEYSATASYTIGARVWSGTTEQTTKHYRAIAASTGFALTNTTKWFAEGLPYDAALTYANKDYVYTVGTSGTRIYWVSLQAGNNAALTNASSWAMDVCKKQFSDCELHFGPNEPLNTSACPGCNRIAG